MINSNKAILTLSLNDFKNLAQNTFANLMIKYSLEKGIVAGEREIESWKSNYDALNVLFTNSNLPDDVIVSFEYRAPVGGRVDCILFGKDNNGKNNVVLFELKGWVKVDEQRYESGIFKVQTVTGKRSRIVEHPSMQAKRYHQHFEHFMDILYDDNWKLTSLAYCYNYNKDEDNVLYHNNFAELIREYPLYSKDDKTILGEKILKLLSKGQGKEVFDSFSNCNNTLPTKNLLEAAADIIFDNNEDFILLGDQGVAYTMFEGVWKEALNKNKKSVIVVKGGPGTGKTVIALKILSDVARQGKSVFFATRSTALRDELQKVLNNNPNSKGHTASDLIADSIFKFRPSQYNESELDVLIIDEAHRISKSANDQTDGTFEVKVEHEGEGNVHSPLSQILSLIYCAKVTIFFIDDKQAVESGEIGRSEEIIRKANNYQEQINKEIELFNKEQKKREEKYPVLRNKLDKERKELEDNIDNLSDKELEKRIKKWEKKDGKLEREILWKNGVQHVRNKYKDKLLVESIELETQFRCIGADKFIFWLDNVLYKSPNDIKVILQKDDYEFKIFDDPEELYQKIKSLNHQDGEQKEVARLCAGWCWKWDDKQVDMETGDLKKEVVIGDFKMPWETKQRPFIEPYRSMYAPSTNEWASDPKGINQIGCIYTAQGFEFDYVGVIIGPDLKYDEQNDKLYTITDNNMKKKVSKETGDILIRNIYRVLMSRGRKACYIYACDPKVTEYFKRFMK